MACSASPLTHWRMSTENGYLYCYGRLNGRAWETSYVTSIHTTDDYYVVCTANSVYHLYYEDSKR